MGCCTVFNKNIQLGMYRLNVNCHHFAVVALSSDMKVQDRWEESIVVCKYKVAFTCLPACLCSLRDFHVKMRILFDLQLSPGGIRHSFLYGTTPVILFPLMVQLWSPPETLSLLFFSYSKLALGYVLSYYFKVTENKFRLNLYGWKVTYLCMEILFQLFIQAKERAYTV